MDLKAARFMAHNPELDPLPDYDNPPVVETVLGVQFDRLPGFKNAHLGAFWKTLDSNEWPTVVDVPLLPFQFERFTEAPQWSKGLQLKLTQDPACRLQIRNKDNDRMIQVQNGRLHFNWLGKPGGGYPRYEKVRDGFEVALRQFSQFVGQESVGDLQPNQWEVTYVNHIPKGTVWSTPNDWSFFKPLAGVPMLPGLVQGESFSGEWHFVIPDERGRLHVQWRHGTQADAQEQEMVVLTLTARGSVTDPGKVFEEIDLGHDVVVRSFASLVSRTANDYWRLKNANA
jgi:uncharacterized protein (TIGR04255 family)